MKNIVEFPRSKFEIFSRKLRILSLFFLTFVLLTAGVHGVCPDTNSPGAYGWLDGYPFTLAGSQERFYFGTKVPNPAMRGYGDTAGADQTGIEFVIDPENCSAAVIKLKIHVVECSSGPCTKNLKWSVWIDYDGNEIFEENEKVVKDSGEVPSGDNVLEYPVDIPGGNYGVKELRANIAYSYQNDKGPDSVFCYGDVEDYEIELCSKTKPIPEFPLQTIPVLISFGGYLMARSREK